MKRAIIKWLRVEQDLAENYAFIAQDKIQPAERLLVVAEESFDRLARNPLIGLPWKSKRPHLRGIHHYPMPPPYRSYVIFYRVTAEAVEVIAILHGFRDLESRLRDILE